MTVFSKEGSPDDNEPTTWNALLGSDKPLIHHYWCARCKKPFSARATYATCPTLNCGENLDELTTLSEEEIVEVMRRPFQTRFATPRRHKEGNRNRRPKWS